MTYEPDRVPPRPAEPVTTDRGTSAHVSSARGTHAGHGTHEVTTGSAIVQILGLGAVALVAMGLLAFGYNSRESATQTARSGEMSIQAEQPTRQDYVDPADRTPAPTTSTTGQGASEGEQRAPNPAPAPAQ
jgi:hypothetical protein